MVLAKSEPTIAKHYDDMLVTDQQAQELGIQVREYHVATERAILDLTQHNVLAQNNPILLRQLSVRNPYVDCLNILQAETLQRIRNESRPKDNEKLLQDTLLISITGVANGMGNTG
jgi:phosphoenolpyruvate carboxylase